MSSNTRKVKKPKIIKLQKPRDRQPDAPAPLKTAQPVSGISSLLTKDTQPVQKVNRTTDFTVKIHCTSDEFQFFTREMQDQAKVDALVKRLNKALSSQRYGYEIDVKELEIDVNNT